MRAPLLICLLIFSCAPSVPEPPEEFREAFAALDLAFSKELLEQSSFAARFPHPTPRQVVSYLLSEAGGEVLQVSGSPLGESIDQLSTVPIWPPGITLWHSSLQVYGARQVILTWDDAAGTITGEAFVSGSDTPVFTKSWHIPQLQTTRAIDLSDKREFQAF